MEITGKVHCFFEQSGTFKNEFIKLGIPAEDYDIQNNFGETDHTNDLFQAIEDAYDGKPSLWDNITTEDLIIAFFPCIYFCENNQLALTYHHANYRKLTTKESTEKIMERARNRQHFYELAVKMFANAKMRGIRLIMENPWSGETFLKHFFVTQPSLIDKNRMMRGDYFTKPTAYWFVNCEPTWGGGIIPKRQREKTHRKPASWQRSWNLRRRAEHDKPGLRPELHLRLHHRKDTNQHANSNTIRITKGINNMKDKHKQKTPPRWNSRRCVCFEITTGKRHEFASMQKMAAFIGCDPRAIHGVIHASMHTSSHVVALVEDEKKAVEKLRFFRQQYNIKKKTEKKTEVPLRIDSRTVIYVTPDKATEEYAEQWRQRYYECNPRKRGGEQ